jgi:hypothetical protein
MFFSKIKVWYHSTELTSSVEEVEKIVKTSYGDSSNFTKELKEKTPMLWIR